MAYSLEGRLVVGIASSALFDLEACDAVFNRDGEEAYRAYQEEHLDDRLDAGVAFPFIKRLLSLNDLGEPDNPPVEVIVLSRNDPDTGLRVMRSIEAHDLPITRVIFMQGKSPLAFISALNMSLFLSGNERDVAEAVEKGFPAGLVLDSSFTDDPDDRDLRVAFDFDGVLADDASESIYQQEGLEHFQQHETANATVALDPGPLRDFLANLNTIQKLEMSRRLTEPTYRPRVHVSILTARSAPAHERALASLKAWGVTVNDAFFLGGIDKGAITAVLRPHIFFDDQKTHLEGTSRSAPSVHVPFGAINREAPEATSSDGGA